MRPSRLDWWDYLSWQTYIYQQLHSNGNKEKRLGWKTTTPIKYILSLQFPWTDHWCQMQNWATAVQHAHQVTLLVQQLLWALPIQLSAAHPDILQVYWVWGYTANDLGTQLFPCFPFLPLKAHCSCAYPSLKHQISHKALMYDSSRISQSGLVYSKLIFWGSFSP